METDALILGIRFEDGCTNSMAAKSNITAPQAEHALIKEFGYEEEYFDQIFLIINSEGGPIIQKHWLLYKDYQY